MDKRIRFAIGLISALAGAALMFHGTLLGENTAAVAIILGIIGIALIATSGYRLLGRTT